MSSFAPLKIIFAGTPEFAATALQALMHTQHTIVAVYTQPDRPAGRGRKLTASPVKQLAQKNNIPVYQPESLKNMTAQQTLAALNADVMVVAAYGLILPVAVLSIFPLGCINIHASLLPRWRGASPIHRAILAGDGETGITIMQMDKGLDTGAMLLKKACPILKTDTSATLHDKLANLGAESIVAALDNWSALIPETQPETGATYAAKLTKAEANIDWRESAETIARLIRAFNPWPVAFAQTVDGEVIRIWEATLSVDAQHKPPGTITKLSPAGIEVATGRGSLVITALQFSGGRVLSAVDVVNANTVFSLGKRVFS